LEDDDTLSVDVVFELAWAKGATMTTEQAIALALR
jgi:hypothetical protein